MANLHLYLFLLHSEQAANLGAPVCLSRTTLRNQKYQDGANTKAELVCAGLPAESWEWLGGTTKTKGSHRSTKTWRLTSTDTKYHHQN